jgi:transcriptional regulator with XRE-family HTH domain
MEIGEKIRNYLKNSNMPLNKFCTKYGIAYSTVIAQLNRDQPNYDVLAGFCKELPEITLQWLFGTDSENEDPVLLETNKIKIESIIKQLTELKESL